MLRVSEKARKENMTLQTLADMEDSVKMYHKER
jgi:hypothetical protein